MSCAPEFAARFRRAGNAAPPRASGGRGARSACPSPRVFVDGTYRRVSRQSPASQWIACLRRVRRLHGIKARTGGGHARPAAAWRRVSARAFGAARGCLGISARLSSGDEPLGTKAGEREHGGTRLALLTGAQFRRAYLHKTTETSFTFVPVGPVKINPSTASSAW